MRKKVHQFWSIYNKYHRGEKSFPPPPVCNRVERLIIEGPGWSQFLHLFRGIQFCMI
jgi:hypothetical protein